MRVRHEPERAAEQHAEPLEQRAEAVVVKMLGERLVELRGDGDSLLLTLQVRIRNRLREHDERLMQSGLEHRKPELVRAGEHSL